MVEPMNSPTGQKRFACFGLLCMVTLLLVLQWQFKLAHYFDSKVSNYTLVSEQGKSSFGISFSRTSNDGDSVSCDKLIQGEEKEVKKANEKMTKDFRQTYMPEIYPPLTQNCSSYIATRGYINFTVNKEEELFPIAFNLLVYKHVEQVERLLRAIWRPHNLYCIHVDKKSNRAFQEAVKSIAKCFPNVFIHPVSLSVVWGTFTVLEPELLCLDWLWKQTTKWKYFINLTGQEFPLKTNYELYLILKSYNGANDIQGTYKNANRDRWKGEPPHKIQPRKGSVHIAASRGYIDYLLHNKTALDLLQWVKNTSVPDETYFATLNYNPHLKVPGSYIGNVDDGKGGWTWARHKIWYDQKQCTGKFVRGICIFSVGDLTRLTKSRALFANKFHFDYHYLAYDCLENWYHGKVSRERQGFVNFNTSVYSERWIVSHHF